MSWTECGPVRAERPAVTLEIERPVGALPATMLVGGRKNARAAAAAAVVYVGVVDDRPHPAGPNHRGQRTVVVSSERGEHRRAANAAQRAGSSLTGRSSTRPNTRTSQSIAQAPSR